MKAIAAIKVVMPASIVSIVKRMVGYVVFVRNKTKVANLLVMNAK